MPNAHCAKTQKQPIQGIIVYSRDLECITRMAAKDHICDNTGVAGKKITEYDTKNYLCIHTKHTKRTLKQALFLSMDL